MNRNFTNIEIPTKYSKDNDIIQKIKDWLQEHKYKNFQELNKDFKEKFNCNEDLKQVNRKNTGSIFVDNISLNIKFKETIKDKHKQLIFDFDNEKYGKFIKNMRYAPSFKIETMFQKDKDRNLQTYIKRFHNNKKEMKNIIYEFFKHKYNQDLSFEDTVLKYIGFNACKVCLRIQG